MSGPLISQVAVSTPFEPQTNPDANGLDSTLTSTNVQDAIEEAQPKIQKDGIDVGRIGTLNFTGDVTATSTSDYGVTINVTAATHPLLREATAAVFSFGYVNTCSALLFEADPINDTINFLIQKDL